eukprot:s1411_g8.t1
MDVEVEIQSDDGGLLGLVPDSWPPGPVRIAAVLPDSQAAKHQLRVGDELRCINGTSVESLEHRSMALELAKRPLTLQIHRPSSKSVVIDVQVDADAGALGFFPKHWPPGPVVVGAVLPKKIADDHGVREGALDSFSDSWGWMEFNLLWLVGGAQASLMSPATLTKALAQRPQTLRFVRGDSPKVAMEISKASNLLATSGEKPEGEQDEGADHEGGLLQQVSDLQVQQLHLQQLQHRKEQETQLKSLDGKDKDWLSLLERQKDEKYAMQSMQREHLSQLGESLQQHQDLLGALDRDEGTGYSSGPALPPLKIRSAAAGAAVRKPPKPPPLARRSREAEKMEEQKEQKEEPEEIVTEEKMEKEPELQEPEEQQQEEIEQIEMQRPQEPEKSEEIQEQKPEEKQVPEQLQADKPKVCQELSVDQTTQTEIVLPAPQDEPPFPSPVATEFSGLKPLSALEPQMSQFDLPKTRQRQLQVPAASQAPLPGLVEPSGPQLGEPRRLRELPPPERPPREVMADIKSQTDCNPLVVPSERQSRQTPLDINELQSWLARSSLSSDAVIF